MYITKKTGYVIRDLPYEPSLAKALRISYQSRLWKIWRAVITPGTATNAGVDGVDMYVALYGMLPDYYITDAEAEAQGWKKWLGNSAEVLPGRMIGGKIYRNRNHRLPEAVGRIWHEADFDYISSYRNNCRLLYSNDGFLFVTYDHYLTFCEIGLENII